MTEVISLSDRARLATAKPIPLAPDSELKNLVCPCGGSLFEPKLIVKIIPKSSYSKKDGLLNSEEEFKTIQVLICTKCGKDPSRKNDIGLPEELCYPPLMNCGCEEGKCTGHNDSPKHTLHI